MIRHVVIWKFKNEAEGKSREENMAIVRDQLYALRSIIPEIRRMEIGIDVLHTDASMDLMVLTEFDSLADLKYYAEHPEHLKVASYVRKVVDARVALDSEF